MPVPKCPLLTVDIVIKMDNGFVFIKRKNEPFKNMWALPGGFVDIGETIPDAAVREAKEETGLDVELIRMIGVYSDPKRDPRGHTVSIAYLAKPVGGELKAADDAKEVTVIGPKAEDMSHFLDISLAFDHLSIVNNAIQEDLCGRN